MINTNESRRVNILKDLVNSAVAEIEAIENKIRNSNITILKREMANLMDGVGRGFVAGDYYAGDRYYSDAEGVKNIRFRIWKDDADYNVCVKVLSPKGKLLPDTITVRGITFKVIVWESERYSNEVDY